MEFVFGALGALFVAALLGGGFALGWTARGMERKQQAEQADEETRRTAAEREKALSAMLNYNPNTAYGMDRGMGGFDE